MFKTQLQYLLIEVGRREVSSPALTESRPQIRATDLPDVSNLALAAPLPFTLHGVVFDIFILGRDRPCLGAVKAYAAWSGSNSVNDRMMRSGLTVESAGRPSPWTSIQIA